MAGLNLDNPSKDAMAVLHLLRDRHNVLISGPPATGKSRLLAELRHWFQNQKSVRPAFDPSGPVAFLADQHIQNIEEWLPSPEKNDRKVFPITFHQGTKYRDFVSGLSPRVGGDGGAAFIVTRGPLFEAAKHALTESGAALVEVDEINRGPAVAVFGDTITAIESDKRRLKDGSEGKMTASFRVLNDDGTYSDFSLPHHLYIIAAMNEADTSVEPLDVAFLRRFEPYRLLPDETVLRNYFSLPAARQAIPDAVNSKEDIYEAAIKAWAKINERIELARGAAFQIGHGVFMDRAEDQLPADTESAKTFIAQVWSRIRTHIEEVFFGDTIGISAVLRAGQDGSPYSLEEKYFADTPVARISGPKILSEDQVYAALRAIAGGD
ncbi:MAG TPA: AAA family ATPase [Blastocatellia bacterium]|jgi:5-methylcytosine-specific restriction protein B|nr:AAA family ATPase [Blastocatellia bacterium]